MRSVAQWMAYAVGDSRDPRRDEAVTEIAGVQIRIAWPRDSREPFAREAFVS